MDDCCKDCAFWLDRPMNPICRRFPKYEIHGAGDCCGEFNLKMTEPVDVQPLAFDEFRDFISKVEIESVTSPVEPEEVQPKKRRQRRMNNKGE